MNANRLLGRCAFLGILVSAIVGWSAEKRNTWGVYEPSFKDAFSRAKAFEAVTGMETSVVAWHMDFTDRFPLEACAQVWASHRIPMIKWDLKSANSARTISIRSIVEGDLDPYLQSWADEAAQFEHPVFIELLRQFNRAQVTWSAVSQQQNASQIAAAFRKIVEVFRDRGADNVRWIWCPHIFPNPPTGANNLEDAFPGKNYVDFTALEGFDLNRTTPSDLPLSFEQMFGFPIRKLKQLAPNKPILLTDLPLGRSESERERLGQGLVRFLQSSETEIKGVVFTPSVDRSLQEGDVRFLKKMSQEPGEPVSRGDLLKRPFWFLPWLHFEKADPSLLPVWKTHQVPITPVSSIPAALAPMPTLHMAFPGVTQIGQEPPRGTTFSGLLRFGWNATGLLFWCEVNDPTVGESNIEPSKIWDGDHLELAIGATPAPENIDLNYCVRLQISPGNASHMQPSIAWIQTSTGALRSKVEGLDVRSQFGVNGKSYRLYGIIPWKALGYVPQESRTIRLNATLTDNSGSHRVRQLIWSGGAHAYHDPGEWGYLEFLDETSHSK